MSGQNIQHLARTVTGTHPKDVETSAQAWFDAAQALGRTERSIQKGKKGIREGFGADSEVTRMAIAKLNRIERVLREQRVKMEEASTVLYDVASQMRTARTVNDGMPDSPGPAPTVGPIDDEQDEVAELKKFANKMRQHQQQVTAYGDADERARRKVLAVNTSYQEAITVLAKIHGEPDRTTDDPDGRDTGGVPPVGPRVPRRPDPRDPDPRDPDNRDPDPRDPDDRDPDDRDPDNRDPDNRDPDNRDPDNRDPDNRDPDNRDPDDRDPDNRDPWDPRVPDDTDPDGPGGPGTIGTGVGAGLLGGVGARAAVNAAVARGITVPGQPTTRPIGGTTPRAGSGVLGGRGGAGVPGQAVGRGAGRGVGAAGAGRGAGRRGGAAGAAGGRGRSKKDDRDLESQTYEADEDWTEDDGQYPGVIG